MVVDLLAESNLAPEIVEEMDLYRAGKSDSSLKAFLDDLRAKLNSVSGV